MLIAFRLGGSDKKSQQTSWSDPTDTCF
jgi:hypothetical protein